MKNRSLVILTAAVVSISSALSPVAAMAAENTNTSVETEVEEDNTAEAGNYYWRYDQYTGAAFWYENGVKQGTYSDPQGVMGDGVVRGREIYDPDSHAWYWLDAVYDGAKAVNKEVWMPYIYKTETPGSTNGKWVRYDESGRMITGWYNNSNGRYYYDPTTGAMSKGLTTIGGKKYYFDDSTGVMRKGWYTNANGTYYLDPSSGEAYTGTHTIDGQQYNFNANGLMMNTIQTMEGDVLYNANGIRISFYKAAVDQNGLQIGLRVQNNTNNALGFSVDNFSVDGVRLRATCADNIAAKTNNKMTDDLILITVTYADIAANNLYTCNYADFSLGIYNLKGWQRVASTDTIHFYDFLAK